MATKNTTTKSGAAAIAKTDRNRHPKSRKRWESILSATTELFNERGFAATSMQDISDKVGLKKGSLYYYVESKEQLLFDILHDLHHGGEVLVASVNFDTMDALGELRAFLVQIGMYAAKHADRLRIFSRDFHFLTEVQQKEIISERYMYRDTVMKLIERAISLGQVSPNIEVKSAAQVIIRAVSSIEEWYRPDRGLQLEQLAIQTAMLMVQGLAGFERK